MRNRLGELSDGGPESPSSSPVADRVAELECGIPREVMRLLSGRPFYRPPDQADRSVRASYLLSVWSSIAFEDPDRHDGLRWAAALTEDLDRMGRGVPPEDADRRARYQCVAALLQLTRAWHDEGPVQELLCLAELIGFLAAPRLETADYLAEWARYEAAASWEGC